MNYLSLLFLSVSIFPADLPKAPTNTPIHSRQSSNKIEQITSATKDDLEKAVIEMEEAIKKNRKCTCSLTRTQVGIITGVISSLSSSAITIASMYSKCQAPNQPPQ